MATENDGFNHATLTWAPAATGTPAALGPLTSISYNVTAAEVDVSGSADATKNYEAGIDDEVTTCEIVGCPAAGDAGDKGAVAVTWKDGEANGSITAPALLDSLSISGSLDGPINSTLTFCPSGSTGET